MRRWLSGIGWLVVVGCGLPDIDQGAGAVRGKADDTTLEADEARAREEAVRRSRPACLGACAEFSFNDRWWVCEKDAAPASAAWTCDETIQIESELSIWCKEETRCRVEVDVTHPVAIDCAAQRCDFDVNTTDDVDLLCRKGSRCEAKILSTGDFALTCFGRATCTVSGGTMSDFRVNCEKGASCDIVVADPGSGKKAVVDCAAAAGCRVEARHDLLSLRCPSDSAVVACGLGEEDRTVFACGEGGCTGPVSE